jgi:hypothetical protein
MVYQSCLLMEKLDKKNHKLGNHLDEFESHLFLEKLPYVDAQTAHAMRDALLAIDIDFDKTTSLLEFLIYIFQIKNWPYVATFVGGASAEDLQALEEAKRSLNQATAALEDSKAKSDAHELAAAEAEHEKEQALHEEQLASAAAATAKVAKADLALAKAEAEQALGSLQAEEKKRADAIAAEEAKCADETLSTVKKGRAKAMLKILESEDSQVRAATRARKGGSFPRARALTPLASRAPFARSRCARQGSRRRPRCARWTRRRRRRRWRPRSRSSPRRRQRPRRRTPRTPRRSRARPRSWPTPRSRPPTPRSRAPTPSSTRWSRG